MNLILLFPDDFISAGRVRLAGRRLKHVLDVHRASVGDELCVGALNDRIGVGKVVSLNQEALEMDVRLERRAPVSLPVTLVLALPRKYPGR